MSTRTPLIALCAIALLIVGCAAPAAPAAKTAAAPAPAAPPQAKAAPGSGGQYGFLGVAPEPVPPPLADQLGLEDGQGVLLAMVQDASPADKAGLRTHDIVVRADDQRIYSVEQFTKLLAATKPGTSVGLTVVRDGKTQTVKAKLGGTAKPAWKELGAAMPCPMGLNAPAGCDGSGKCRMRRGQGPTVMQLPGGGRMMLRFNQAPPPAQPMMTGQRCREAAAKLRALKEDVSPNVWKQLDKIIDGLTAPRPAPAPQAPAPAPGPRPRR